MAKLYKFGLEWLRPKFLVKSFSKFFEAPSLLNIGVLACSSHEAFAWVEIMAKILKYIVSYWGNCLGIAG